MTYEFLGPRRIVAGEGSLASIAAEVRNLKGTKPLIVTDSGIAKTDLLKRLLSLLDQERMTYGIFSEVEPDPGIGVVEKGRKVCVEGGHDLLIAFGGGSSIDAAKVIGILARNEGTVKDYMGVPEFKHEPVPIIAIPTTAGTGSEVTLVAIVTDEAKKLKLIIRSPQILPATVLLDPTLLTSLPPEAIAHTGMDAFSHAVESFLSVRSNPISEPLSLAAVRLIYQSLIPFKKNPRNVELASSMLHASCLAGIAFANSGLGAVHALAHPIGSHYHLSHGLTCALFLRQVLQENKDSAIRKYRVLLDAIGANDPGLSDEGAAEKFIEAVDAFMETLGIPKSLSAMGVKHEVEPMMIEDAVSSRALLSNPKQLERDRIVELLWSIR